MLSFKGMPTLRRSTMVVAAAAVTALLIGTGSASAASVDFSTGLNVTGGQDDDWSVSGPVSAANAYVITPNPVWTANPGDGSASWIGPSEGSGNSSVAEGLYTYSRDLGLGGGSWLLSGEYTSDNVVVDILFNGSSIFTGDTTPADPTAQFTTAVVLEDNVTNPVGTGSGSLLEFVVRNDTDSPSPSGFIVQGEAAAVPTPSAALAGLGLLGIVAMRRRRWA